jgi:ABC-type polysaccharide/polyol phosphate transport system ATPase subunit
MSVAIKVEDLSKAYQLGEIGTGTVSRDIERWLAKVRGKEDPFLKVGEVNDRTVKGTSNIVWSLKDISFEIEQGDAVGIIGRNGAGKSTLLKILSRVTSPTKGVVKARGRIASLLEVGTGFHPELTGRENIYLNGAILGMRKKEITDKLDQIVDFSGVERYLDTPVKRYSSGMYVRLAFAVAAHLDSEILIVDEVLAVGDAEFQAKCLGKMKDVSSHQGRTVLFVSHNMAAIQKLCSKGILLNRGQIAVDGNINNVLDIYVNEGGKSSSEYYFDERKATSSAAHVTKVRIEDADGRPVAEIPIGRPWRVKVSFRVNEPIRNLVVGLGMLNGMEVPVRTSWNLPQDVTPGDYTACFEESQVVFSSGTYRIMVGLSEKAQSIQYLDDNMYIYFSDVIENMESSVIKNDNGIILNQMNMYVKRDI